MPRPGHRLDVMLVARPVDREVSDVVATRTVELLKSRVKADVRGVRVDRRDRPWLFANQQGGFHVRCPVDGMSVVVPFSRAWARYRDGKGERAMRCLCGEQHLLEALDFLPMAAFGRVAVTLLDVSSARVVSGHEAAIEAVFGPFDVVARRVG